MLEVVENFTYLGSTISITLNIEVEMKNRIVKTVAVMVRLTKRVWNNSSLTETTRLRVDQACVLGTLFYGSETWTTHAKQEKKLNSFHILSRMRPGLAPGWTVVSLLLPCLFTMQNLFKKTFCMVK